jgi:hypothetical protein
VVNNASALSKPLQVVDAGRPPATAVTCLRCQLLGHRRLMCDKAEACKEVPMSLVLGPAIILGWLTTVVAFVWVVW